MRHARMICICVAVLVSAPFMVSQTQSASFTNVDVPRLIRFAGTLKDATGKPLTGTVGITFSLHKDQQRGAALWIETQNVVLDAHGHYSVMLGATKPTGIPTELFVSGEARWLGVQVAGQAEQPRALLLSVPYALKAADAETVGGLPPSAFLLAFPGPTRTSAPLDLSSWSFNAKCVLEYDRLWHD